MPSLMEADLPTPGSGTERFGFSALRAHLHQDAAAGYSSSNPAEAQCNCSAGAPCLAHVRTCGNGTEPVGQSERPQVLPRPDHHLVSRMTWPEVELCSLGALSAESRRQIPGNFPPIGPLASPQPSPLPRRSQVKSSLWPPASPTPTATRRPGDGCRPTGPR
jgi:hypothetical protein